MTLPQLTEYRQSTLRAMEVCPRRTRFALELDEDLTTGWTEGSADLGTVFHAFVKAYMEQLATPEFRPAKQMPTEEAVNVARTTYAELPIVLDSDGYEALMGMVVRFCEFEWDVNRILALEDPLHVDLLCSDGEVRTVKGQPDLIMADPPHGVIIYDWKTGLGQPKAPKVAPEEGAPVEGKQYLSDAGKYQRRVYGLLALHTWPSARYAVLWEVPMRFAKYGPRHARLSREQLEHVESPLADHMMKLDQALRDGPQSPLWKPKNGAHCFKCEVARSCPVPPGQRGTGALESQAAAHVEARRWVRGKAMYEQAAERLKAWQEAGHPPGQPNERDAVRWGPEPDAYTTKGGGRGFKLWPAIETTSTDSEAAA